MPRSPEIPLPARLYASSVILAGGLVLGAGLPWPVARPFLCLALAGLSILTSTLKVRLPLSSGSATMSVSYVVDLMAIMLLGPQLAVATGAIGAWAQCVASAGERRTGVFKTLFSVAALIVTVRAAGAGFTASGGVPGLLTWDTVGRPLVTAVVLYYLVNTSLVAGAIGLTSGEGSFAVWRQTFLWSAPSYMVGAGVAAVGVWLVESGGIWFAPMALAPGYLTYRTHRLYLARIADARRHAEEITGLHEQAQRLESLGVLAGGIAHDFNNILTAIVGNVSIARADPTLDPETAGHLREAEQACVRAKALTHQLLTFSKGGAPVKRSACLNEVVREAATFALRGTSVRCDFLLQPDLWSVEADEGQMVQVVNNLVINAQQAMPGGGSIVLRTENVPAAVGAAGDAAGARVRIVVQDNGIGIPEENLGRIFDPYFTTKRTGSGLGLATAYSIVRKHGGRIDVLSALNQGTTMTITLPAQKDRVPAARVAPAPPAKGKGRVLVMDDEASLRKLACAMLGRLGYDVEVAADGREAIEMYRRAMEMNREFDVVVMDLTVPGGVGGKDAIKDLLRIDPTVRAIVSSGYADDPVMADFEQYGFKAIVPKPFGSAELSAALQQVLN